MSLADRGFTTLSIQRPVLAADAPSDAYAPLFPLAADRIAVAAAWLAARGYKDIVLVSHSLGSRMANGYFDHATSPAYRRWIALGLGDEFSRSFTQKRPVPVLDVQGDADLPAVLKNAAARRRVAESTRGGRQLTIAGADHFYAGRHAELIAATREYLRSLVDSVSPRSVAVIKRQLWEGQLHGLAAWQEVNASRFNKEAANLRGLAAFLLVAQTWLWLSLCRGDSRSFGLALESNFDDSAHCAGCFDQCVELNRQVARVQYAVQLGPTGGHALCHVHFAEFAALHGIVQLLGQCAFKRTGLHFFVNAVLFEEVIKTTARVRIDFSCFGHGSTPSIVWSPIQYRLGWFGIGHRQCLHLPLGDLFFPKS
jgi:hypothetical protein